MFLNARTSVTVERRTETRVETFFVWLTETRARKLDTAGEEVVTERQARLHPDHLLDEVRDRDMYRFVKFTYFDVHIVEFYIDGKVVHTVTGDRFNVESYFLDATVAAPEALDDVQMSNMRRERQKAQMAEGTLHCIVTSRAPGIVLSYNPATDHILDSDATEKAVRPS